MIGYILAFVVGLIIYKYDPQLALSLPLILLILPAFYLFGGLATKKSRMTIDERSSEVRSGAQSACLAAAAGLVYAIARLVTVNELNVAIIVVALIALTTGGLIALNADQLVEKFNTKKPHKK